VYVLRSLPKSIETDTFPSSKTGADGTGAAMEGRYVESRFGIPEAAGYEGLGRRNVFKEGSRDEPPRNRWFWGLWGGGEGAREPWVVVEGGGGEWVSLN